MCLPQAKLRCTRALACTPEPTLLARTLRFAFNLTDEEGDQDGDAMGVGLRSQGAITLFDAVAHSGGGGGQGLKMAWAFLRENWALVHGRYGSGGSKVATNKS